MLLLDELDCTWLRLHEGELTFKLFMNDELICNDTVRLNEFRVGSFCFSLRDKFIISKQGLDFFAKPQNYYRLEVSGILHKLSELELILTGHDGGKIQHKQE